MSSSGSNYFRGLWGGGTTPTNSDVIDYITIQATGNAVDFGNLVAATVVPALAGSSTRGIWMGGYPAIGSPSGNQNTIQYVEWSTKGNTADFGDLIAANEGQGACSNAVRMVAGGGYSSSADVNVIQYITIASLGNAIDFGDLTQVRRYLAAASSPIRGVFAGGYSPNYNEIDYVQIPTTGNAVDFGNLQSTKGSPGGSSNGHGGLT